MIRNGYYVPKEFYDSLMHWDYEKGEAVGKAQTGVCFGNRKGGKTVGHGIEMIKRYNKHNERCMILARTDKQKERNYLQAWWNKILNVTDDENIIPEFVKNNDIKITPELMTVNGDPFCYCEAISMSKKVKDEGSYDHCTTIIIDEAVQIGEHTLWIQGRAAMQRIFEIWQTVARGWEGATQCTNLVFIANVSTRDNWVFNELGINNFVRNDTKFTVQKGICVEIVNNKAAAKEIEESYMGMIMRNSISGKEYYESAQNNKFTDNTAFVKSVGLDFRKLRIQLIVRGECIGVFKTDSGFHVSKINPDSRSRKICNMSKYHTEDVDYEPFGEWEKNLREIYRAGLMTFQTQESKNLFLDFCREKYE